MTGYGSFGIGIGIAIAIGIGIGIDFLDPIAGKLGVNDRTQAAVWAARQGLI